MYKCSFCAEINNSLSQESLFNSIYYEKFYKIAHSRIVQKNDKWLLMPTIGCFIEGYLLAVHTMHFKSLFDIPEHDYDDLLILIELSKKFYKKVYNKEIIFFEHGIIISSEDSSCCIEHAHIHFLPQNISIWEKLNKHYKFNFTELKSLYSLKSEIIKHNMSSYMLFSDIDNKLYLIDCSIRQYPSQFFRISLYQELFDSYDDKWDWKKHAFIDKMMRTYLDCNDFFNNEL